MRSAQTESDGIVVLFFKVETKSFTRMPPNCVVALVTQGEKEYTPNPASDKWPNGLGRPPPLGGKSMDLSLDVQTLQVTLKAQLIRIPSLSHA